MATTINGVDISILKERSPSHGKSNKQSDQVSACSTYSEEQDSNKSSSARQSLASKEALMRMVAQKDEEILKLSSKFEEVAVQLADYNRQMELMTKRQVQLVKSEYTLKAQNDQLRAQVKALQQGAMAIKRPSLEIKPLFTVSPAVQSEEAPPTPELPSRRASNSSQSLKEETVTVTKETPQLVSQNSWNDSQVAVQSEEMIAEAPLETETEPEQIAQPTEEKAVEQTLAEEPAKNVVPQQEDLATVPTATPTPRPKKQALPTPKNRAVAPAKTVTATEEVVVVSTTKKIESTSGFSAQEVQVALKCVVILSLLFLHGNVAQALSFALVVAFGLFKLYSHFLGKENQKLLAIEKASLNCIIYFGGAYLTCRFFKKDVTKISLVSSFLLELIPALVQQVLKKQSVSDKVSRIIQFALSGISVLGFASAFFAMGAFDLLAKQTAGKFYSTSILSVVATGILAHFQSTNNKSELSFAELKNMSLFGLIFTLCYNFY